MQELLIILAKEMPESILLQKLKDAIDAYSENKNPETKHTLDFHIMLAIYAMLTKEETVEETIGNMKDVKEFKEFQELKKEAGL